MKTFTSAYKQEDGTEGHPVTFYKFSCGKVFTEDSYQYIARARETRRRILSRSVETLLHRKMMEAVEETAANLQWLSTNQLEALYQAEYGQFSPQGTQRLGRIHAILAKWYGRENLIAWLKEVENVR